jgi:hypothetical protein
MITEKQFIPFLQKNINIVLENKTLKQGKLLLFSIKDFYLNFTLLCNNVTKTFELPYPFATFTESLSSGDLVLDYRLSTLHRVAPDLSENISLIGINSKHMKFFNNVIKVVEIN